MVDSNQISKNLLLLKREVEAIVGQRDEVAYFTNKINAVIVQFHRTVQSLKEDKKVFKKIVEGDLTLNAIYSTIRYQMDLNGTYNGAYWDLEDSWEQYKYQVLGIELPENLI
jgi:hypothetical protein